MKSKHFTLPPYSCRRPIGGRLKDSAMVKAAAPKTLLRTTADAEPSKRQEFPQALELIADADRGSGERAGDPLGSRQIYAVPTSQHPPRRLRDASQNAQNPNYGDRNRGSVKAGT